MDTKKIRSTYETFLKSDISLDVVLEFDILKNFDNIKFIELQQKTFAAKFGNQKHIDNLANFVGKYSSSFIRERLLSSEYTRIGNYEKGVEWCLKALEVSPVWDLDEISSILHNMAWALFLAKNVEEAKFRAETALTYNPFLPYTVGTLIEIYQALGLKEKAKGNYLWLKQNKFDAHFWGNYKPDPNIKDPEIYSPNLSKIKKLSDSDIYKIMISQLYMANRTRDVKNLNLALACYGAGKIESALYATQCAITTGTKDYQIQGKIFFSEIEKLSISENIRECIKNEKTLFHSNTTERYNIIEKTNDIKSLWILVFNPDYGTSMTACKRLLELGVRSEIAPYLKMAKEWEYKTGKSVYYEGFIKPYELEPISLKEQITARGEELIEKIIEHILSGKSEIKIPHPKPISKKISDNLFIQNNIPVSPSMKKFIEFDITWLEKNFPIFSSINPLKFNIMSPAQALTEIAMIKNFADNFIKLPYPMPQADCLPLNFGAESARILFLGITDKNKEYPVLCLDISDIPCIYMVAAGFDIWLAEYSGLIENAKIEFKHDIENFSKLLFGNKTEIYCNFDKKNGTKKKGRK